VRAAELKEKPAARAATQREWDRLRSVVRLDGSLGCWDEHLVRERKDVRRDARIAGKQAQVGLTFGIVVEKNTELCLAEPLYNGRAVFQGNNVRNVNGDWAIFQELGSCPSTMEAARCADACGLLHDHAVQQSDAEQAFTQAWLDGTATWVRLPRDQWPASWANMTDPVCPLRLDGHPDSGGHWEKRCFNHRQSVGNTPVPNSPSCFWHPELRLFLVVYVDDVKLSGPVANIAKGWSLIRNGIRTEESPELGLYLGCKREQSVKALPDSGIRIRVVESNMEDFLCSCVGRYNELTGVASRIFGLVRAHGARLLRWLCHRGGYSGIRGGGRDRPSWRCRSPALRSEGCSEGPLRCAVCAL